MSRRVAPIRFVGGYGLTILAALLLSGNEDLLRFRFSFSSFPILLRQITKVDDDNTTRFGVCALHKIPSSRSRLECKHSQLLYSHNFLAG